MKDALQSRLTPGVPVPTAAQGAQRRVLGARTGLNLVGDEAGVLAGAGPGCGCLGSPAPQVPCRGEWAAWRTGETSAGGEGKCTVPVSEGGPSHTEEQEEGLPQRPILANLGYRDGEVKPPGWGARVGRKQGDPPCTLSPGWPGCREAINWSHSSHNEMEMKPPDRGALSWGRMVASSRAWRGSPRPCPLLCCPPKPPRQGTLATQQRAAAGPRAQLHGPARPPSESA